MTKNDIQRVLTIVLSAHEQNGSLYTHLRTIICFDTKQSIRSLVNCVRCIFSEYNTAFYTRLIVGSVIMEN